MNNLNVVGTIEFDNRLLSVYQSLDDPIFKASDIAKMIDYSDGNTWKMLQMCEEDEKMNLPMVVAGQTRQVAFITEMGLYNILAQSRKLIARKWRRVVHTELIRMRKEKNMTVVDQFDEWDDLLDTVYWDEERGMLMQSVTVQGGDVEQIPYVEEDDVSGPNAKIVFPYNIRKTDYRLLMSMMEEYAKNQHITIYKG